MSTVPLLDLADRDSASFVRSLHDALHVYGFVGLVGHGLPDAVVDRVYAVAEALFALPEAEKRACETPADGRQRGYTPFGVEHAKDSPIGDLKEFWHVGHPGAAHPANRFPAALPGVEDAALDLFQRLEEIALTVLGAIAVGLELPPGWFDERVRGGNSVLRILHYPALPDEVAPGALRSAPHEDINLLTLLPVATEPGLEILTAGGQWLAVDMPRGALVCDTGDMMQLWTGGRLRSTTHRVVNPTGPDAARPRYSLPFFVHPHSHVRLDPIDGSGGGCTAGEYLDRRLRETGVRA